MSKGVPTPNRDEIIEELLTLVRDGDTLRHACAKLKIPERTVRSWRHDDHDLDVIFFNARLDSAQAKLDVYEDGLKEAQKSGDRNQILAADKLLSHARWEAEKLLEHYNPTQKQKVEHVGPVVFGWDDGPERVEKSEEVLQIGTVEPGGGDARKH